MSANPPSRLNPILIGLSSQEFQAICTWPYTDPFVRRLLLNDIPQRVKFGNCRIWVYRDANGSLVGFGTLDVCCECSEFTGGKPHPYIPLLAVNPNLMGKGYGTAILSHLVDEAALLALEGKCHDVLFLDVYTTSQAAIGLYKKNGFIEISAQPIPDPDEGGKTYIIMAKRVSVP
ncbi:MAG: GNAT family N-acetyltransferase [Gemmatales bacterium]|nr:GNAT family N-acetyltransferase [Gemmatales bacterium]MDW8387027.1 GNAT family N-acetyltransferase [Gemmatales bacterium]